MIFRDSEVGHGSSEWNAICSQLEVADDVISGESVDTFQGFVGVSLWFAIFRSFRENLVSKTLMKFVDDGQSIWAPFPGQRAKMSNVLRNIQESPPIGGAVWNATTLIPVLGPHIMLAITWTRLCDLLPTGSRCWRHFLEDVETFQEYVRINLCSSWSENLNQIFMKCVDTTRSPDSCVNTHNRMKLVP